MTLGDHINSIILQDYGKKDAPPQLGPDGKSFLSQINGQIQQGEFKCIALICFTFNYTLLSHLYKVQLKLLSIKTLIYKNSYL